MATTHIQGDFITYFNGIGGRQCPNKCFAVYVGLEPTTSS